ncbi:tyrosine--tRNA ligase 2, cytoplasmic-like isoform X2 [Musa acuminata AAA Group]|uniref:tyrosine--tRNA ligase 2, cytoplasmic-like isoform X2 n=1 Tax=Musa acuminata AAA Group TaxID=214697 RepID=UPI0031DEEAF8
MLPRSQEGQEKMSQSDPSSSILMEDEEADATVKIKKAYCPPKIVEGNPCLEYIKRMYNNMEELILDYESGALHPADLKPALSKALNVILQYAKFLWQKPSLVWMKNTSKPCGDMELRIRNNICTVKSRLPMRSNSNPPACYLHILVHGPPCLIPSVFHGVEE